MALMSLTRAVTGHRVPIIGYIPLHASFVLHLYGPEHLGGHGDLGAKIDEEATRLGITIQEIGDKVLYHTEGRIDKVPGLPAIYDWEAFPQRPMTEGTTTVSDILKIAYSGLKECDSAFSLSAYDFEPESVDALKSWFAQDWNKEVYTVGPLLASKPTTYGGASALALASSEIDIFLDKSLKEYGEKSLVLISFGSLFWPSNPEYIEEVIEALIERKFPFIVSYASIAAQISEELNYKITSSGVGLISKWVPQKFILDHSATGWFITHAGQSGVLEALDSGVPMICWPFEFDQPLAAVHLSTNLNVAFELVEVRTGQHGMKPLLRLNGRQAKGTREAVGVEIREVLDACLGEKGAEMRRNVVELKGKFARAWGGDGAGRRDFNAFLNKYGINLS